MREETMIGAINDIDTIARLTEDMHERYYNNEPDYWEKLKHQYAGMAMQGILANPELCEIGTSMAIASIANTIATELVNRLKEESQCKE